MHWTYISPHFDDVVFSCGGLIWEQSNAGEQVNIWTIFAGDPPEGALSDFAEKLQIRWRGGRLSMSIRRQEDVQACARIGSTYRHFTLPDCIYRGISRQSNGMYVEQKPDFPVEMDFFYRTKESLFGPINNTEMELAALISEMLADSLPEETKLVCPLALGNHVDHQLTRAAVEKLDRQLWYYGDYPYVKDHLEEIETLERTGWRSQLFPISGEGKVAWKEAVEIYQSQISSFWAGLEEMQKELEDYWEFFGGVMMWQPPKAIGSIVV